MTFKETKAIYLQIADLLMDDILQDRYAEGERIPSVREYSAQLEVNVNTCVRAYDWLCLHGVIYTKRGLGYFVGEGAKQAIMKEMREEFFNEMVPTLKTAMQKLGVTSEQLMACLG